MNPEARFESGLLKLRVSLPVFNFDLTIFKLGTVGCNGGEVFAESAQHFTKSEWQQLIDPQGFVTKTTAFTPNAGAFATNPQ